MRKTVFFLIMLTLLDLNSNSCSNDSNNDENKGRGSNFPISTALKDQQVSQILPDNSGNAFVLWTDYRSSYGDIYAQKLDKNMTPFWAADGVAVTSAAYGQTAPSMCLDGSGGFIVIWEDSRESPNESDHDIYIQKIRSTGVPAWTANGIIVSNETGNQFNPVITSDGSGGAIVAWADNSQGENSTIIYTQKINDNGAAQWAKGGVSVSSTPSGKVNVQLISTGLGGAIITWWNEFYLCPENKQYRSNSMDN